MNVQLLCAVEGADDLKVNLIGSVIPQPDNKIQNLSFKTKVRQEETQIVKVTNPSAATPLVLKPSIKVDSDSWIGFWSVPDEKIVLEAKATHDLKLT